MSDASSASARDRASASNSWEKRAADSSRDVIVAAAMVEHFRPVEAFAATASEPTSQASLSSHRIGARIDLLDASGLAKRNATPSGVVSPIPEPSSILLLAAGAGTVAWLARRSALTRAG